ncbi:hypothetical protein J6590_007978 [Homalodisca vitripennis]|nr:hypothetical protein J6590_007978 [Homalodisca vitripennis]
MAGCAPAKRCNPVVALASTALLYHYGICTTVGLSYGLCRSYTILFNFLACPSPLYAPAVHISRYPDVGPSRVPQHAGRPAGRSREMKNRNERIGTAINQRPV